MLLQAQNAPEGQGNPMYVQRLNQPTTLASVAQRITLAILSITPQEQGPCQQNKVRAKQVCYLVSVFMLVANCIKM